MKVLTEDKIKWAYEKWCIGYTLKQISAALYVHKNTLRHSFDNHGYGERERVELKWEGKQG